MREKLGRFSFDSVPVVLLALALGVVTGLLVPDKPLLACTLIAEIFMRLLKLISMPLIFFSLLSTLTGMDRGVVTRIMAGKLVRYTVLTTFISTIIALLVYLWIAPASLGWSPDGSGDVVNPIDFKSYLLGLVPLNVFQPFLEGNVVAVLFLAVLIGFSTQALESKKRDGLHQLFENLFSLIMAMTKWILKALPVAIWAFVVLFIQDLQQHAHVPGLGAYFICLIIANGLQALVVLPLFLYFKGISPLFVFRGVCPALVVAFLSKSSSAALPTVLDCAQRKLKMQPEVAKFSLPLCITINMNACAAFILITVLFVSQSNGFVFSPVELVLWVIISVVFAIGNAGVPMGCYMISSAILVSIGTPLHLMMLILPLYAVVDMFESAINVYL